MKKIYKLSIHGGATTGDYPYDKYVQFDKNESYYENKESAESMRDYICDKIEKRCKSFYINDIEYTPPRIPNMYCDKIRDHDGNIKFMWNGGYASLYITIKEIEVH